MNLLKRLNGNFNPDVTFPITPLSGLTKVDCIFRVISLKSTTWCKNPS